MKKIFLLALIGLSFSLSAQRDYNRDRDYNNGNRDDVYQNSNPYNDPNYYPDRNYDRNYGQRDHRDIRGGHCNQPQPIYVPSNYCRPVVINPYPPMPLPIYQPYYRPVVVANYGYGRPHPRHHGRHYGWRR